MKISATLFLGYFLGEIFILGLSLFIYLAQNRSLCKIFIGIFIIKFAFTSSGIERNALVNYFSD
jgi:hypothetical protein